MTSTPRSANAKPLSHAQKPTSCCSSNRLKRKPNRNASKARASPINQSDYLGLERFRGGLCEAVAGSTPQDVMQLVLMTQYFDTLKEIAANDHSNTILIPHTPNTLTDLFGQIRNAVIAGTALSKQPDLGTPSPAADTHQ